MIKIFSFFKWLIQSIATSIHDSYKAAPPEMQKRAKQILGVLFIVVTVFISWTVMSNIIESRRREAEILKGPRVRVAKVTATPADRTVKVTGEARPFASVTLYAKVSGYIKKVLVDKGDVVKKDQILAIIESPETDKAYEAAFADEKNKSAISVRIQKLFERNLVSQQERDQAVSDAEVSAAHLQSQLVLKSYETLRAPFAGTITARFADPGALMQNATSSQTSALPVVSISQVNQLRVYVYLDQRDAAFAEKGTPVQISLSERPGLVLEGRVARLAGELDEKTRMLLTEIDLDNAEGKIVPGSLVDVSLHIRSAPGLEAPVEALVLREGKPFVPVISDKDEVNYSEVEIGDNDGQKIKLLSGVKQGDEVALNLGGNVPDHGKVRPIRETPGAQK
jgi:RND family efflux transporter MFP subunit